MDSPPNCIQSWSLLLMASFSKTQKSVLNNSAFIAPDLKANSILGGALIIQSTSSWDPSDHNIITTTHSSYKWLDSFQCRYLWWASPGQANLADHLVLQPHSSRVCFFTPSHPKSVMFSTFKIVLAHSKCTHLLKYVWIAG